MCSGETARAVFADLSLARRLVAAEAAGYAGYPALLARLDPQSEGAVESFGTGRAIFAGVGSPLSRAIGLGLNGPVEAEELERLEQFYLSRGAHVLIDLCPLADGSLVQLLGRRGYRLAEFFHIWFRPLGGVEEFPAETEAVEVREAAASEAELWIRTVTRGFTERDEVHAEEMAIAAATFRKPDASCFLARVEGEAAGGAALSINEGLAALYSASTVRRFRRRGVQAALLSARLRAATVAGCDLATVKTAPGTLSQRNVERAGFRLAYTRAVMTLDRQP